MSGLFQRLVGQAAGGLAPSAGSNVGRIRSAASVHALVPVAPPPAEQAGPERDLPHLATRGSDELRPITSAAPLPAQKAGYDTRAPGMIREARSEPPPNYPARVAAAAVAPPPPNETREPGSTSIVDRAPQPLLEEDHATRTPITIEPHAVRPVPPPHAIVAARAESSEVHVHIGRIEVIAAPETSPPKKNRATQVRETLPLADYLARRRRT